MCPKWIATQARAADSIQRTNKGHAERAFRDHQNSKGRRTYICISNGRLQSGPKTDCVFVMFWTRKRFESTPKGVTDMALKLPFGKPPRGRGQKNNYHNHDNNKR